MENGIYNLRPISIPYWELKDRDNDLSTNIEEGFGPTGLGIITVTDVPEFTLLRQNLLELAPRLADLPEDVKKMLEDPDSRANNGWSFGNDNLDSGNVTTKGSFYANPVIDVPTTDPSLMKRYPSYCRPNRWPKDAFPELEVAFKALGKLMLDVGLLVAYHCDRYVSQRVGIPENEGLKGMLMRSKCHKGRLIYYYPAESMEDQSSLASWCGWHTDWSCLTGLTAGMFMENDKEVENPDSAAGLYIKMRNNQFARVVFGEDEIAYQVGETAEVLSKGLLYATAHSVRAPAGESAKDVGRSTFVLFMQPNWDEVLKFPEVVSYHQEFTSPNEKLAFGDYTERRVRKYSEQGS